MQLLYASTIALVATWLIQTAAQAQDLPPPAPETIEFTQHIAPLLAKHCQSCHGAEKQESGLRLDGRVATLTGGDSGKAVIVGESSQSRLIHYVSGLDKEHLMPPEGPPLSTAEVGRLRAWIDQGLKWSDESRPAKRNDHWAYQPLADVAPPQVKNRDDVRNPVDQFVLAKLEEKGLTLARAADRTTLIRRLSLDLLGLLPTIEQVDQFLHDDRPEAYEMLVDRWLESPHFGERWGRHWLDMARYADSDGYEKDNPRPDAYRYRDWVIDAFNADMPFDQFTLEQLAGDLLPDANDMQRLATAFHRQTLTNTEGGTDQEQFRVEACFDRTETTGAVWLGLTIGCARCHTHKYDAITQREYYQLFAFFNNGDETTRVVPKSTGEIREYELAKAEHDRQLNTLREQLVAAQQSLLPKLEQWERETQAALREAATKPLQRERLQPIAATSDSPVRFEIAKDSSVLVSGENPDQVTYTLIGKVDHAFDTVRLDALMHKSLPAKGPGRVKHGNFVLTEIIVEASATEDFQHAQPLKLSEAVADFEQADKPWLAKNAIDGKDNTGWAIGPQYGQNHWAEFRLQDAQPAQQGRYLRVKLRHLHGQQHTLGRFKLSTQTGFSADSKLDDKLVKILQTPASDRRPEDRQALLEHFSKQSATTKSLHEKIEALEKRAPPKPEVTARVLAQRTESPRATYVLRRGEFLEPVSDSQVNAGSLAVLPPLVSRHRELASADRLDLARWLVSSENPLTPRVAVNHIWRTLFGDGLVRTPNDFGVRGDRPTHPELLDWLAAEFSGRHASSTSKAWSRKGLIKLIVMSATYRQSSQLTPELRELDPQNQLLARQNRLRVEGEVIRDVSLDAAGLLSRKIGGPSVYPLLPPGIAELSYAGNFKWNTSSGEDLYRRGMYTFFKRTSPHPNLITFDCPDANLTCVDRNSSNTPLQALVTLNNASFAEAARGLAQRALTEGTSVSDAEKLRLAFRWCLAREPRDNELGQLIDMLSASRGWYIEHGEDAKKLVDKGHVTSVTTEETAAWIATMRVLINLDEFITRE